MKIRLFIPGVFFIVLTFGSLAHGAVIFSDDFESSGFSNWTIEKTENSAGFAGNWIRSQGGNNYAMFWEIGISEITMSKKFSYIPDMTFNFDMDVFSYPLYPGQLDMGYYSIGGVEFGFYDSAQSKIAKVSYLKAMVNGLPWECPYEMHFSISRDWWQAYSFAPDKFLALIDMPEDSVSFIEMRFFAQSGNPRHDDRWPEVELSVDNVNVSSHVPCPPSVLLMGSSLLCLAGVGRKFNIRL